ncbi:deoxyribodipyrimidine photo-lyase [Mytilus galloprovincialis]|uniref:Deoxyribodipyrimidine photo-lyase n=1 Tax=Mytilus galloprovincialis TaxID=29158 RepID=A0A8B6D6W7_MYTGA|nr:deoxyribodipyrimidine photo-lyase [Mytilus galloprovincialis]
MEYGRTRPQHNSYLNHGYDEDQDEGSDVLAHSISDQSDGEMEDTNQTFQTETEQMRQRQETSRKKSVKQLMDSITSLLELDGTLSSPSWWKASSSRIPSRVYLRAEIVKNFSACYEHCDNISDCNKLEISFHLLIGYAKDVLPQFVTDNDIGGVVTDFSPLRTPMQWVDDVTTAIPKNIPICQVDAHNIVPCWEASPKLEYGARTIRNKIHNQLSGYLTEFPPVCVHPFTPKEKPQNVDWAKIESSLTVDRTVGPVDWATPGSTAGLKMLESFCKERLKYFSKDRNNPNKIALSNLSPWIHFGQISVQRSILIVKQYRSKYKEGVEAYIEEAIIRRELADNFCFYNKNYDSIEGAYDWAKTSLKLHEKDKRKYLYTREKLEKGQTHDDLWNAAQIQMTIEGKMHGFLRMYWAKKILEWTGSPTEALETAIYLNDRFNLDGRDPNGYVGCMWSICGIHDQGWKEREIFGKIRYMNYDGCKRKFDVAAFVRKYRGKKL